jgi:hypothetical protein
MAWRRRTRFAGAAAALGVTAVSWVAIARYRDRDRPGPVQLIVAVDRERAIVLRGDQDRPELGYVELVGRDATSQWRTRIARPRARPLSPLETTGVTVGPTTVTVETQPGRYPQVTALQLADGAPAWRVRPAGRRIDVEHAGAFYSPLTGPVSDASLVVGFYGATDAWNEVVGFDRATGAERLRVPLGPAPTGPAWLRPGHVVIKQRQDLVVVARDGGPASRFRVDLGACLVDDTLYYMQRGALRARRVGDDHETPAPPGLGTSLRMFGLCGRRGDAVLILMATGDDLRTRKGSLVEYAPLRLIALDAATLQQRWQVPLGAVTLVGGDGWLRTTAPGDQLGKIVPVRVMPAGIEARPRLVLIDTDQGRELGRTTPVADLLHVELIRCADRIYVLDHANAIGRLAVFDQTTGSVTAALEAPHDITLRSASQQADGRLWIGVGGELRVLDAATLQPVDGGAALPDSPSLRALLR